MEIQGGFEYPPPNSGGHTFSGFSHKGNDIIIGKAFELYYIKESHISPIFLQKCPVRISELFSFSLVASQGKGMMKNAN